jgi:hypothetical protein
VASRRAVAARLPVFRKVRFVIRPLLIMPRLDRFVIYSDANAYLTHSSETVYRVAFAAMSAVVFVAVP